MHPQRLPNWPTPVQTTAGHRNRAQEFRSSEVERAARYVGRRFALPIATALMVAESAGLGLQERGR